MGKIKVLTLAVRLELIWVVQTPNLAHYSSYAESALVPVANIMLNYVLKPIRHESFYKKYAGKRYLKVRGLLLSLRAYRL
jgi:hypothetical protein